MNIVGYGGGTDSTAMLVGLWQHHVPVDLILFADPGGEQPHTYHYLRVMDQWLQAHGMPHIQKVWYTDRTGQRLTLEQECLAFRFPSVYRIRLEEVFSQTQSGSPGEILRPLSAMPGCLGRRREGGETDRL